jgi:predicted nucleotidyltransferase
MNSPTNLSLTEIKQRLTPLFQEPGLQIVLLFGSRVSGRVHPGSDIDLGVLFDGPVDLVRMTSTVTGLLRSDRVDLVDLRRASPLLAFSAARQRLLLYERSAGLFNQFYSLSFRRYIDTKKLRDAKKRTIQNFLKEKGLS